MAVETETEDFNLDELSEEQIDGMARRQGWTPEEEWDEERAEKSGRRKPARFFTAREYLDRLQETMPALRGRLRRNDEVIEGLNGRITEMSKQQKETADLIRNQAKMAAEANKAAYERGIKEATERMRQAKVDSDFETYEEARDEKARLEAKKEEVEAIVKTETEQKPAEKKPEVDDDTMSWVRRNSWFQDDSKLHLNAYMIKAHKQVKAEQPDLDVWESLEEAKKLVVAKFPEDFGKNPARDAPGSVRPPGGGGSKPSGAKARFDALPGEHKAEYERQKKVFKQSHNADFTIEEFLEAYGQ